MIVVRIKEGLGNQMFQYAFARAISLTLPYKVKLDTGRMISDKYVNPKYNREYRLDNFKIEIEKSNKKELRHWNYIKDRTIIDKYIFDLMTKNKWKYKFYYENNFNYNAKKIAVNDNTYLVGWFQNERYFINIRNILLSELRPVRKIRMQKKYIDIMKNSETVSIHIRRGDYVSDRGARMGMGVCKMDYYERAIKYMEKEVENPFYFVFTDDIAWTKANFDCEGSFVFVADIKKFEDWEEMVIMSKCKHNIIANSTFSWWGAWLNTNENKIVIAPEKWFKDGTKANIAADNWILC